MTSIYYKAKSYLSNAAMKMLYMSLSWSLLNYGVLAWGKWSVTLYNKFQAAQICIVRRIYGISDCFYYKINKLMDFDETYKYLALLENFKEFKYCTANHFFLNRISRLQANRTYTTRFSINETTVVAKFNRAKFCGSLIYNVIHLWNILPLEIRNVLNLSIFKRKLKEHVLTNNVSDNLNTKIKFFF